MQIQWLSWRLTESDHTKITALESFRMPPAWTVVYRLPVRDDSEPQNTSTGGPRRNRKGDEVSRSLAAAFSAQPPTLGYLETSRISREVHWKYLCNLKTTPEIRAAHLRTCLEACCSFLALLKEVVSNHRTDLAKYGRALLPRLSGAEFASPVCLRARAAVRKVYGRLGAI